MWKLMFRKHFHGKNRRMKCCLVRVVRNRALLLSILQFRGDKEREVKLIFITSESNRAILFFFLFFFFCRDRSNLTQQYCTITNAANVTGSARDNCIIQLTCYPRVNSLPVHFLTFVLGALTSLGNALLFIVGKKKITWRAISKSLISETLVKRKMIT